MPGGCWRGIVPMSCTAGLFACRSTDASSHGRRRTCSVVVVCLRARRRVVVLLTEAPCAAMPAGPDDRGTAHSQSHGCSFCA